MSKSTGSKGSDNNSKGDNSSSSSSSDSESKGSSASKGGGGSDASSRASESAAKSAAEAKARTDAATKASAEGAAKAGAEANDAASQGESQHQAAVDAADKQQKASAETYGSFVKGVLDAAPVGVDNLNKGRFGTDLTDAEINNKLSEADHGFAANQAWNAGRYGDWASEKLGGVVDSVQGWGMEQARELTQAPLDKMADLSRNPAVKGIAMLAGGPIGLALTGAIGIADSVADYAQGEKTGKQSAFQGLGDLVGTFGPPQAQVAYSMVTNPKEGVKKGFGMMTGGMGPIVGTAMTKGFGYGVDKFSSALNNDADVMGPTLTASRQKADGSYESSMTTRTQGSYTKPVVMNNDAMMLDWQKLAQQQQQKPRYSSSLLFNMS